MAAKRKLEFDDYSEMTEELGSADVHGVLTQLSPIKKSKRGNTYYHGRLCDGKHSLRLIGFATSHHRNLNDLLENKQSIEFRNCQIKKSNRDSDTLEVMVKGATKISVSPKRFTIPPAEFRGTESIEITLNQVDETEPLTIITVNAKVISCGKPITLGTRQKQDIIISDSTAYCTLQLWEDNIGKLVEGCSYQLKNFRIIEYESIKYVAMCWNGSETHIISDLKDTVAPPNDDIIDCITINNPQIAAVYKLETFFKCLRCGSRTEPGSGILNEARCCNKECGILNNTTFCEKLTSTEILVINQHHKIVLTAFADTIYEIIGNNSTPTQEKILQCPPIQKLIYKQNGIIKVHRQ